MPLFLRKKILYEITMDDALILIEKRKEYDKNKKKKKK